MTPRTGFHLGARQSGFSLLEALVAMAIASIAFTVLYRTVGQSAKAAVDVDARVEAALVAQSVLASATFAEELAPLGAGACASCRSRYFCKMRMISPLQSPSCRARGWS